jgi:uncharacterized protein (UPF0261 family)
VIGWYNERQGVGLEIRLVSRKCEEGEKRQGGKGMRSIIILGTLDTKGEQIGRLKEKIEARGHKGVIIDLSSGGVPHTKGEVTASEISSLAGKNIEDVRSSRDRSFAAETMTVGAQRKIDELLSKEAVDGIVALGGMTMALIGSRVMQSLPFGIPKVIATTAAMPAFVNAWFDAMDVTVTQMIVEMRGMNQLVKNALDQVAGIISGMVEESASVASFSMPHPSVAVTEFGFCEKCAQEVERLLKEKSYHVFSFHAQGISDKAMEKLISRGLFDGVIDIVPSGLTEELFEGNRASGMERLEAAVNMGIPKVLAPSGINCTGSGPTRRNREKYASRPRQLKMDEMRWHTRLNPDELRFAAKIFAEKLNKARGPVRFLIPLKGWGSADREGSILYSPEEDRIFSEELKRNLKPEVEVQEIDCNLDDIEFAKALVDNFDTIFKETEEKWRSHGK